MLAKGGDLSFKECVVMENCVIVRNGAAMLIEFIGRMGKISETEGPAPLRSHVARKKSPHSLIVQSLHSYYNRFCNIWKNGSFHLGGVEFQNYVSIAEVISPDLYHVYPTLEHFNTWEISQRTCINIPSVLDAIQVLLSTNTSSRLP